MALDSSRSQPVPVKQTLVIVNEFIINTGRFLNHFATLAEEKLAKVSGDIERVETALVLLESRLSRIPGMEDTTVFPPTAVKIDVVVAPLAAGVGPSGAASTSANSLASSATASSAAAAMPLPPAPPMAQPMAQQPLPPAPGLAAVLPALPPLPVAVSAPPPPAPVYVMTLGDDPAYAPFFKMCKMGVPAQAVKQKMVLAGVDPAMLDRDPASPSPSGGSAGPSSGGASAPLAPIAPAPAVAVGMTVGEDPAYAPFFKMMRMGVPAQAVKQKVSLAGLNPSVLDMDPSAPSPG